MKVIPYSIRLITDPLPPPGQREEDYSNPVSYLCTSVILSSADPHHLLCVVAVRKGWGTNTILISTDICVEELHLLCIKVVIKTEEISLKRSKPWWPKIVLNLLQPLRQFLEDLLRTQKLPSETGIYPFSIQPAETQWVAGRFRNSRGNNESFVTGLESDRKLQRAGPNSKGKVGVKLSITERGEARVIKRYVESETDLVSWRTKGS